MARIRCICGQELNNQSSLNETSGKIITDYDLEITLENSETKEAPEFYYNFLEECKEIWECNFCGRLIIFEDNNKAKYYFPEDGEKGNLMKR